MTGPTVEELLKAGGTRRAPPQVGAGETFVNRTVNAIPGGRLVTDALSAAALELGSSGGTRATLTPQAQEELQAMGEEVATPEGLLERYRQVRDRRAERTELGSEQNPWAGRAGTALGIGLSALAPLPKFAGKGLMPAVKTGAGYGAFEGATNGQADLTRGEVGQALVDTAKGAAFGAGAGAVGHGLVRAGQKGVQALRGARSEVLAQETAAVREGAEEAQAAAAKVGEKERKMIGQAREMNKSRDARAARVASREQALLDRAKRRGQPAGDQPPQEPSTKVLEGMRGKAFERQQNRSDKALGYRRSMGDPDVDTQLASARQDFIDQAPEALSNPAALRRQYMERFLRQKYGDDVAERVMRERVGPEGEILPRGGGAAPAAVADDATSAIPVQPPALGPRPAIRQDIKGTPYGRNLLPEEPPTVQATQSMAAPKDTPLSTPAATPATPPPQGTATAPLRPSTRSTPPEPVPDEIQDVTRLAGADDLGPLAAERAAAREQGAVGAIGRAGMAGVRSSGNVLGAVLGGLGGITRELLRDPAVKARALSAAKLHLLERINPQLFAQVGGTLAAAAAQGESRYRAQKYLEMRRNPELRVAEAKAAEEAARLSDDQLMSLIATGAASSP